MVRSFFRVLLLASLVGLLGVGAGVRAEIVTFDLDPARSSVTSAALLVLQNPEQLIAQDAPANTSLTTRFTGTLELDVDDPLNPQLIKFESGHVVGLPSGEWLPEVGGGSVGDPGINGDADPGMPADAQFGYKLDLGDAATGYVAFRDTAFTLTSDLLFVNQGEFRPFITLEATQGFYDFNLRSTSPGLGDTAGTEDVAGETADNSGAANGTYMVNGLQATLTLPVQATFGEGGDIEVRFTGELVATAFFGQGVEGDYNDNGLVEQEDLDLVLAHWGDPASPVPASWLNDLPEGNIDQTELDKVLANWGNQAGGSLATGGGVPEPSTLILLLLAPTPLIGRLRW